MTAQLEEAIDLELTMSLDPVCEDDHLDVDDKIVCECSITAVARFVYSCRGKQFLICKNLVDWAVEPPGARCSDCHPSSGCLKIIPL